MPWQINPKLCTTQSYEVTDTMSIQRDLHCRKKEEWSRHAERSKDREHMAPGEKKDVTVVHFS